ncbi:MAG: hypothetical protein MJE68_14010, partial [Proteobacteria bacterium]|nr:hypothetical protein [Pseudomonadota bacterium]
MMKRVMDSIAGYLDEAVERDCLSYLDEGIELLRAYAYDVDIVPFVTTMIFIATTHQSLIQSWRLNTSKIPLELLMAPIFHDAKGAAAQIECLTFYAHKMVNVEERLIALNQRKPVEPNLESDAARDSDTKKGSEDLIPKSARLDVLKNLDTTPNNLDRIQAGPSREPVPMDAVNIANSSLTTDDGTDTPNTGAGIPVPQSDPSQTKPTTKDDSTPQVTPSDGKPTAPHTDLKPKTSVEDSKPETPNKYKIPKVPDGKGPKVQPRGTNGSARTKPAASAERDATGKVILDVDLNPIVVLNTSIRDGTESPKKDSKRDAPKDAKQDAPKDALEDELSTSRTKKHKPSKKSKHRPKPVSADHGDLSQMMESSFLASRS